MTSRIRNILPAHATQDVICLLLLVGFFSLYYFDFFLGTKIFTHGDDNTFLLAPTFAKISSLLSQGELPTHVDTSMGGLEFYNSAQFSIYYPLYPFHFIKLSAGLHAASAINLFTLLHILLGSISCYILARTLRASPWGALFAGLTFCAANNTRIYASWINITAPYAWVPLILCGLIQLDRQRLKLGYVLTTISFALTILASPSQPMIHSLFLLGCAILYWGFLYIRTRDNPTLGSLFFLFLAMATVFLLSAPVIVPTGLEMKDMIRWLGPFGAVIGTKPLSFEAFLLDEAPVREWSRIFMHGSSASLVGSSFIGLVPGLLALAGLLWIRWHPIGIAFAILALYGLLSSFGTHSGMAYLNYQLPLINKIREPSRHLVLFVIAMAALAALGASSLQRIIPRWAFAILISVGIAGHFRQMKTTLEGYPPVSATDVADTHNQEAQAALNHIHSTDPKSFVKILDTKPNAMFFGMNAFYYDDSMKTVDGYYNPQRYSNHRRIMYLTPAHEGLMRLSGITHLVCGECPQNLRDEGTSKFASYTVKELDGVRYPTLYPGVSQNNNPFIITTVDGDTKPVALDGFTPNKLLAWPQAREAIDTQVDRTNYKRYIVEATTSSLFVTDNLFSLNWEYFVDGQKVASYPVNFMRQGIIMPGGKNTVELRYSPRYLSALFLASALGVALFVAVVALNKIPLPFRQRS